MVKRIPSLYYGAKMDQFTFSELYDVYIRPLYEVKIGNRIVSVKEPIAIFDSLQISNFKEINTMISANGGYHNGVRVVWKDPQGVEFGFERGVFSKEQLGLLWNSQLIKNLGEENVTISKREFVESNQNGEFELEEIPIDGTIFIYKDDGVKVVNYSVEGKVITTQEQNTNYTVLYQYSYSNDNSIYKIGNELLSGFLELEGKTRVKDSETGSVETGLLKIPKFKLMSDFSIRLGKNASPVVGHFSGVGLPVGAKGNSYICEFYLLGDDVDSDF